MPEHHAQTTPSQAKSPTTLKLAWRAFWQVALVTTVLAGLVVVVVLLSFPIPPTPLAEILFLIVFWSGCILCCAALVGVIGAVFAVLWRYVGSSILFPIVGAVLGSGSCVALLMFGLDATDFGSGAGVHGGGHIAAMFILGSFGLAAIAGAFLGAVAGAIVAMLLVWRRRRATQPTIGIKTS